MNWQTLLSSKRVRDFFIQPGGKPGGDHRTQFERDYDRAIFSSPVRRLHDKAQVFPLEPNDSVHTRLTHSLEVSTVSRDMARAIGKWLESEKKISEDQERDIETIAATCGLIHDLGNPPFGHAGEQAIADWFKKKDDKFWVFDSCQNAEQLKNDFIEFDGNPQTIRLVSKLQLLSDLYGLNFTCGTLSAACKYVARSNELTEKIQKIHEKEKVGFFSSEEMLVDLVRHETGTGDARNPITYIVEAADDIVYSIVDLEDGIKKGVIDWHTLKQKLLEKSNNDPILMKCFDGAKYMIMEKEGVVELHGKSLDEAMIQAFRVFAIGESVKAVIKTFEDKYLDIMNGDYHSELFKDSKAFPLIQACKGIGITDVYCSKPNLEKEVMAERVIHDLMDIFWRGVSKESEQKKTFESKIRKLISKNYLEVFENAQKEIKLLPEYSGIIANESLLKGLSKNYCCMQLVTDYICGMTDTFACTLHKRLTNG